jgi:hypothetical protein
MPVFNSATGARTSKATAPKRRVQANFTRPANTTAYAAGDVVNGDGSTSPLTLADVVDIGGGSGRIVDVLLECDEPTVTNGTFRIHFFNASHTIAADNAAFATLFANSDEHQGSCEVTLAATGGGAAGRNQGKVVTAEPTLPIPFVCATGDDSLYAVIEATAGYTPKSAGQFRLSVVVEPDV